MPRAMCVQVRYTWTHSIANTDLLGDRRVSVTFRNALQGREQQVVTKAGQPPSVKSCAFSAWPAPGSTSTCTTSTS
jgi:hypothetical protein